MEGYYSCGEFAAKAHVTKKALRYYDENNILKPSYVDDKGFRYYTDNDFAKLQQIIFLKYLSFPLADIKELTVRNADKEFWMESLDMQTSLLDEHIEQMVLMKRALQEAREAIADNREVNWSDMLLLANSNELEQKLKQQYISSSNLAARITLHNEYSTNAEGWFPWIYRMLNVKPGMRILELGCGDGALWAVNADKIPSGVSLVLSDISAGIVKETGRKLAGIPASVQFQVMDAHHIHAADKSVDVVTANHMLFYCDDLHQVLQEIVRVLKPGGKLVCSTYSGRHMQEISSLVKAFDDRILLSADQLYERFGKENGGEILSAYFPRVSWQQYEDELLVTKPEPLIAYIMSCHGNQNRYIVDKYHEFYSFVKKKTDCNFHITKDAGVFIASGI